ncbi:MAG TPA: hypothetical protein VFB32_08055 [Rudaea sp.]|nr:hypothetical protein [Rudaea sp.]
MPRKFAFSESERSYLEELRALSSDARGREVLVGLTFEETAWYVTQTHTLLGRHRADRLRYLELHDKHEKARQRLLAIAHAEPKRTIQ